MRVKPNCSQDAKIERYGEKLALAFKTTVAVIKIQIILTTVKTKLIVAIIAASFPMSQL
jgi:hypothetical protein